MVVFYRNTIQYKSYQSRANIELLTEYEYEYIRKVEFPIFVFEYPIFGDKNLNIQYIRIFALYKRQFLTEYEYEYIHRGKFTIFVFEYQIFGDKYSNIQIYSNICPTLQVFGEWFGHFVSLLALVSDD